MPGNSGNENLDFIIDKKGIFILKLLSRIIEIEKINKQQSNEDQDKQLRKLQNDVKLHRYYDDNINSLQEILTLLLDKNANIDDIITKFEKQINVDNQEEKKELIKKLEKIIKADQSPQSPQSSQSPQSLQPE